MKKTIKLFGITTFAVVMAFTFTALSLTSCDDGGGGPRTVMYSGTASSGPASGSYSLKIIENNKNPNRAALNDPLPGDNFEFTWTDSANKTKKSAGQVASVSDNEFTMLPANAETKQTTFTTTVSDEGLTAMSGTFTWTDGTTNTGSGTLTPSGGPGKTPGTGGNITWTKVTDSAFGTSNNTIFAIAYGGGTFVAGGMDGKMAYSSDDVNWTAVANSPFYNGNSGYIRVIAYGNGTFVAGGVVGNMAYSTDGVNWTKIPNGTGTGTSTFGTSDILAIAYGNGTFVAGGQKGKMATSPDGVTWTVVTNTTFGERDIMAIVYGNGTFVAGNSEGKMATSPNGVTWTARVDNTFSSASATSLPYAIVAITFGGGRFVAMGNNMSKGKIAASTDGITWTAAADSTFGGTLGGASEIAYGIGIAYGNNKFVTGNSTTNMYYSSDGINWKKANEGTDYITFYDIAYGNGKFVGGGGYGQIAYSSGL
jgi:hypothetical protein